MYDSFDDSNGNQQRKGESIKGNDNRANRSTITFMANKKGVELKYD